jgi:D-arginine dehydrogenase
MADRTRFEVIIIGGGIAGASMAYFLAERGVRDVAILERESQPGYHSTGRSAATLVEYDENPVVQQLKAIGGKFLRDPPASFAENRLVDNSQVMLLFRGSLLSKLPARIAHLKRDRIAFQALSSNAATALVPVLALNDSDRAVLLVDDGRIDVHELLSSYLRHARHHGAVLRTNCEVRGLLVDRNRCVGVATAAGELRARWVVDSAGAWAGEIASLAAAAPIPLEPRRRSIVVFDPPEHIEVRKWPFVISEENQIYFAPESGGLLLSPMDQEPSAPCDAYPEDAVIAAALERLGALAPALLPKSLRRKWAGLRTFSPDGVPVVGEDPRLRGFFWLAGQAGFGIESSPAVGAIAADLLTRGATGIFDAAKLSPARFEGDL